MVDQPLSFTKGWRSFIATAIVCTGAVSASSLVLIPAAEANHYHHRHHPRRKPKREFRRDVRDFNHYRRSYNRDWRHGRRIHNRALYDYPRVIAPYGYGYYRQLQPGFGIQIRLRISLLSGNQSLYSCDIQSCSLAYLIDKIRHIAILGEHFYKLAHKYFCKHK